MLREIAISNFAIVDGARLALGPGMTCLTGETGAGKSILVDALTFILGGRPGPGMGDGGRETSVEALFDVSGLPEAMDILEELGLGRDGELVLRRLAGPSGRGRVYVNGSLANVATLSRLGELLVDIHGQHEHQSLLKVDRHSGLLDRFCEAEGERAVYREHYERVNGISRRLAELRDEERDRARRADLLSFQVNEIESAALEPGEDETLARDRDVLAHADKLRGLAETALGGLRDEEPSALALLDVAKRSLEEITRLAPDQTEAQKLVESAVISAEEAAASLREFAARLESDPERLAVIEDRLELIKSLKKKYGDTVEDVMEFGSRAKEELDAIGGAAEEAESLEAELGEARRGLVESGGRLSRLRRDGAGRFADRVMSELSDMGMQKARFETAFHPLDAPGPDGLERAEFLFSANPGKKPMPLAKIASGGELSRVMLALKVVLASRDSVPTLVFDEVDSGVGGTTAGAVGRKLREAAEGRQVLCITHLPQIASLAGEHYTVSKKVEDGRTEVAVRPLGRDERVAELARMLGGEEGSRTASAHAEELVRQGGTNG